MCGFDCASKNEIKSVLKLGCNPREVIFSNSVKIVTLSNVRSRILNMLIKKE